MKSVKDVKWFKSFEIVDLPEKAKPQTFQDKLVEILIGAAKKGRAVRILKSESGRTSQMWHQAKKRGYRCHQYQNGSYLTMWWDKKK